ncbi:hypothetical protein KJ766_01395 [Patescibacteria group bacterium]|nr:hypothetical protein [Patescibacteria group bacterium]
MKKRKKSQDNKIMAAISYVGVFWVFALANRKKSKFVSFHGKQGFVLFCFEIATLVFVGIMGKIPVLGDGIIILFLPLAFLFFLIVSLVSIWQALKGKSTQMPIISDFAQKINF